MAMITGDVRVEEIIKAADSLNDKGEDFFVRSRDGGYRRSK